MSYEYRLNQLFGIGGIVEYASGVLREWVLAVPLFLHPYKGWRFLVAPGVEIPDNEGDNEFLFRVGAAYEFEIGEKWAITPEFNVGLCGQQRSVRLRPEFRVQVLASPIEPIIPPLHRIVSIDSVMSSEKMETVTKRAQRLKVTNSLRESEL